MRIVLATRNTGKVIEMRALLEGLPVEVVSMDAYPGMEDVEEDAPTLDGNAIKKARAVHAYTGLPALADDTGLEVDALEGRPGVYSARYAGPAADPAANRARLLGELASASTRDARFRTVLAFVDGHRERTFEGVCEGAIAREERGAGGFGYDALFVPEGHAATFAELDPAEKNRISHRGRALVRFCDFLRGEAAETDEEVGP